MNSRNSFPEEARFILQQAWKCWYCKMNTADSLHHIVGRGELDSTCERSILNAAPLCNHKCHLANHGLLSTEEWIGILLKRTYEYLKSIGYELNKIDNEFMDKYIEYYI